MSKRNYPNPYLAEVMPRLGRLADRSKQKLSDAMSALHTYVVHYEAPSLDAQQEFEMWEACSTLCRLGILNGCPGRPEVDGRASLVMPRRSTSIL